MATFEYKGLDAGSKSVSGKVEASDRKAAIMALKTQGIRAVYLKETAGEKASKKSSFKLGVSKSKMALNFLEKFLLLHSGGLPIGDAIKTMRLRLKEPQEKMLAEQVHKDICEGKTVANAMRNFPDIFDENTLCMIEAGEKTGNLITTLKNLVEFLQIRAAVKKKFVASMAYPMFVCVVGVVATIVFLFFVMPRLQKMLTSMGGEMPLVTKLLMSCSDFAFHYWWAGVIGFVVVLFAYVGYRKTPQGRFNLDRWVLKIPLCGVIMRENFYCQLSNLLATMLGSGINMTEAMSLAENSATNMYLKKGFVDSKKMVLDGISMTKAFEINKVFPDIGIDLLSVGESTGDLAHSLNEVFKYYHTSLLDHLKLMTTAITAGAMLVAFSMVGVLAISVISSVLKMTTSMSF